MTLSGLTLAVGTLVDNSIVVLKNVHRRLVTDGSEYSVFVVDKEKSQATIYYDRP